MCVVTNFTSECRGFLCAVSGSEMSCSNSSAPQDAVTGSGEHGVSGLERSRPEALWRGSPWGCPSTIGALPVLRRIRVGFFVGGEGVDLGLGSQVLRNDVAFFEAVRSQISKVEGVDREGPDNAAALDTAIKQIVSEAMSGAGVIDLY